MPSPLSANSVTISEWYLLLRSVVAASKTLRSLADILTCSVFVTVSRSCEGAAAAVVISWGWMM